jgi:membrane fusion protein (multidrug efflux system)
MYASVKIELEKKSDVLLVPVGAVLTEKAGSSVFVVAGGKVKKTPVTTGFADSVNVEITAGLEGSPTVALPGRQTLSDGQSVTVTEAK